MKLDRTIEQIKGILQKDRRGLTVGELAHLTRVSRITAMKALSLLEGTGQIEVRRIGNCKLHYWGDAP